MSKHVKSGVRHIIKARSKCCTDTFSLSRRGYWRPISAHPGLLGCLLSALCDVWVCVDVVAAPTIGMAYAHCARCLCCRRCLRHVSHPLKTRSKRVQIKCCQVLLTCGDAQSRGMWCQPPLAASAAVHQAGSTFPKGVSVGDTGHVKCSNLG